MTKPTESDLEKLAKDLIAKGISINRNSPVRPANYLIPSPEAGGRPKANIFSESRRRNHLPTGSTNICIIRHLLHIKHVMWRQKYDKRWKGWMAGPHHVPMPSIYFCDISDRVWTVYYAAELAWILMGHQYPENQLKRPWFMKNTDTFVLETAQFWRFINEHIQAASPVRRGPKPSAEKIFKTAVATYTARSLLMSKGGHPSTVPTPLQIAQVWYVLFGENERPDIIKKKLPRLGYYCKRFPSEYTLYHHGEPSRYPKLGRALLKNYPHRFWRIAERHL